MLEPALQERLWLREKSDTDLRHSAVSCEMWVVSPTQKWDTCNPGLGKAKDTGHETQAIALGPVTFEVFTITEVIAATRDVKE